MTDAPPCDVCGAPATPGGDPADPDVNTICPPCEDLRTAARAVHPLDAPARRVPPHGNTTR